MRNRALLAFSVILCVIFVIAAVEADNPVYQINAVYGSTPDIDGIVSAGEWSDASTVSFNDTIVYVKQDGKNLYVAFNVQDNTLGDIDRAGIFIDTNSSGGDFLDNDDFLFEIFRNGTLAEAYDENPPFYDNPAGWNAVKSNTSSNWQAEFNITYIKLEVTAGEAKTLGVLFTTSDGTLLPRASYWPPTSDVNTPFTWGNLISTQNWVPELPSFLLVPVLALTTLLAVTASKRKRHKS